MIIWLTSYPKSGNTWLRFFVISLLMGKKTNLNLNHLKAILAYPNVSHFENLVSNYLDLKEIGKNWILSQDRINADKNLRFFKTHNMLGKLNNHQFTDNKNTLGAIHVVRDPRNIITSLKNHLSFPTYNEAKEFMFNEKQILSLSDQEKERYEKYKTKYPLPQIIGSWKTHYLSWKKMNKNYLLVKYENLIENPKLEFTKVAKYIGDLIKLKFDDDQINTAIKLSSFEKLENLEKKHGFIESAMDMNGKKKKFFFLGPKNNWEDLLDYEISNEIKDKFNNEMRELGYL